MVLSVDDLFVVEVAESVDKLVDEILGLGNGQSFSFFDEIEHILCLRRGTPLLHSSSNMYTFY